MTWISDLLDRTIGKLKFFETVNEWEQGLYKRRGTILEINGSKILKPGLYFYFPIFDDILTQSCATKPLDADVVRIMAIDDEGRRTGVVLSCTVVAQVMDLYRAYTRVDDWERSVRVLAIAVLAKIGRGLPVRDWHDRAKMDVIAESVLDEIRKTATSDWGIKINRIYLTDAVEGDARSLFFESKNQGGGAGALGELSFT